MSRRSRRRRGKGKRGWIGRLLLFLGVVVVLGLAAGYALLRNYLHSDGFRLFLSAQVSEAAGVRGEFSPFRWEGLAVDTAAFEAEGEGMLAQVRADGIYTEVDLGGVKRGAWILHGARVSRLALAVDARERPEEAPPAPPEQEREVEKAEKRGWLPDRVEVRDLTVRELAATGVFDDGEARAEGLRVEVSAAAGRDAYQAEISGGSVRLPWPRLPVFGVERIRARHQDGSIFLSDGTVRFWDDGRADATGEWNIRDGTFAFEGHARGIACDHLLDENWAQRLSGELSSTFVVHNHGGATTASGSLLLRDGVLTALPILDALAAYADTTRFRTMPLHEARTDWEWRRGEVILRNLVISSEGLARIEGTLALRGESLDGTFRLGVAPGTLASIPGAETDVFLPGERGLLWAPLRLTGTIDDPEEDLTDRLVDAAGARMFEFLPETGQRVLKFTRTVVGEDSSETVRKGVRALEKGVEALDKANDILREVDEAGEVIRGARGVLEGILGK